MSAKYSTMPSLTIATDEMKFAPVAVDADVSGVNEVDGLEKDLINRQEMRKDCYATTMTENGGVLMRANTINR